MNPIPLVDESRLVNLVTNPTITAQRWAQRAACTGLRSAIHAYFPGDGDLPPVDALMCCFACPVATECLATALIHESQSGFRHGWWGGTSPEAREGIADRLCIETVPVEFDIRGPADLARHLRSQNRTIPSIAVELGCTERTVYRYLAQSAA
ncbi:MAG: WhiB family transcriptional regulator [Actinomycetota bacterium]|jgi:hypothetical protein|nr:WhiB family transcriptional regulator [Actinomycetota bacterium]